MKHRGTKILALLLTLAMVLGLVPGMSLTAYAGASIGGTNIAVFGSDSGTVSSDMTCTSFTVFGSSTLTINQGVTLTLNCGDYNFNFFDNSKIELHGTLAGSASSGAAWMDMSYINVYLSDGAKYTVTGLSCMNGDNYLVYYGYDAATDGNGTVSVKNGSTDVTSTSTGYKTTTYTFTATPNSGYKFKNWTKGPGGEVLGTDASINVTCEQNGQYQVYANFEENAAYTVTLSGGAYATASGGATTQNVTPGQAMTTVTYTANSGYTFPAFSNSTTNGVTLTRVSDTVVTVSGTPTANVNITVPNATAVPTFTVTYIANNGTGETKVYTPAVGQTHNVEGQLFPAPQDKEFNNWLGDDGNTYLQGAQINTNRTLTAQWKDKSQGGGSHGGNGSGADIVFNIPGVGDGWEYIGGGVPQRAWKVSLAPMVNGSAALGIMTGESTTTDMNVYPTTTIYVFPNANPGFVLDKIIWSYIDGSASYDITEAKNFVMPAMDVVVYVTFKPLGS